MQRKVMATVIISLVFFSQLLFLFTQDVKAEGVSNPKAVEYVFSGNDVRTELRRDQSVFMNYFQARSNIAEDVGEGRKITKIEFLMAGEVVKTISVNSRTFNQSIVFDGKEIKVVSKGNIANGSWFAWTIGNNIRNGHAAWEAAGEEGDWGILSSVTPPQEAHGRFMFDKYPGHEIWMKVNYSRSVEFKNEELGQFPTTVIDRAPNRLSNWNPMQVKAGDRADSPGNVRRLMRQEILGPNGITGVTDPSTEITNIQFDSLDAATIRFTQDHKKLGVMSSGGAQTFFFANYEYDITSYTYRYPNVYRVYSVEDPSDECEIENPECVPPPPPSGQCTVVEGTPVTNEVSNPNVSAVIKADQRDNEQFNVADGIPTSESLYGNVSSLSYLFKNKFTQMVGTCNYDVPVTQPYNMEWTEPGPNDADGNATEVEMSDSTSVTKKYTVRRTFTYWVISNFEVNSLKKATLENYAFDGNKSEILPQGYSPPTYATATTGGYTAPPAVAVTNEPKTIGKEVPDEDFTGDAEAAIEEVRVRNDSLTFKGQAVMDNAEREKTGPAPGTIPQPAEIGRDVLYKPNNMIPSTKENRLNEQSQGSIEYGLMPGSIGGGEEKSFTIQGINTVTVHTPVVNYSWATDDQAHNQKTTPNGNRAAFILDRPFTVRIPTSGQHADYLGYGNRDYAKYFRTKQVRFPFDVYTADKSGFYAKSTWIDIPVNQLDTTFFLPVWVDEGDYTVEFRNIAENAPDVYPSEQDANLNLINHIASDTINVEVIGRLYDFHITDVADYNWEMVFRTIEGSATHTGNTYWTGLLGIDGATRGNVSPFTLPILPGSNPLEGTKNVSVKTGYHIKFDLKTKGNMFGKTDGIRITPSFTFVSKDGKTKTPVDLYYNDDHRTFIQVGSPEDTQERYVILNDRLRNVPEEELTDTARYKYDHDYTFAEMNSVSREMFISDYIRRFTKEKTPVGGFDLLLLPEQIRTLIGPKTNLPSSVDYARANAAVQKWYGQYSLPGDPYVVEKGTNLAEYGRTHGGLTRRDPIFLREGYIVLNFNIESIREGNLSAPHLQYMNAPLMNQWTLEGFKRTVQDSWNNTFSLRDGDIVFYNADKSYKDDFQAEVSH